MIKGENLTMWMLTSFVSQKIPYMTFQSLELLNKMEWLKGKLEVLQEIARVMIHMHDTLCNFWAEAINRACCIANRIFLRLGTKKTSYELWTRRKPNLKYFRTFGSEC